MRSRYMSRTGPIRTGLRPATIDDPEYCARALVESQAAIHAQRSDNPENWPTKRKLAIAMIARNEWALDCIARLNGSKLYAGQDDFLYLRQQGYAIKNPDNRYHRLTPSGWRAASKAIFALAGELGLHVPDYQFDSWSEHRVRCCCGFSASVNRRASGNARSRLHREFLEHVDNPEDWKRRKIKVQEIVDRVGTGTLALFRSVGEK